MTMSDASSLSVTYSTTVTPDQIDELGHMNVRWYGHSARSATAELCTRLGLPPIAILSAYTRHHHEQMEGSSLEVRSGVLAASGVPGGSSRLRFFHELRNSDDDDLAATFVHELDHPALETPNVALPKYGQPRTVNLALDRLDNGPSLAECRERDLATRLERQVTADDVHPNDLFWGGERPGGEASWIIETPEGERIASATMESRFWMREFPKVGTPIQSFVATILVGDKITHELGWVFDIGTETIVAAFEGVDLAFSITHRRSIAMPPEMREREMVRYHPDMG